MAEGIRIFLDGLGGGFEGDDRKRTPERVARAWVEDLAIIGGGWKIYDVLTLPPVFEYVFFAGAPYVLMVAGLALVIFALGHDILFSPGDGKT